LLVVPLLRAAGCGSAMRIVVEGAMLVVEGDMLVIEMPDIIHVQNTHESTPNHAPDFAKPSGES